MMRKHFQTQFMKVGMRVDAIQYLALFLLGAVLRLNAYID